MNEATSRPWRGWWVGLMLAVGCTAPGRGPVDAGAEPRSVPVVDAPRAEPDTLEIKFREGQHIRLRNGVPTDTAGQGLLTHAQARELLRQVAGGQWTRSQDVPEETLDAMRAEGQHNTGKPLPDLNLYFRLRLPPGLDTERIATAFRQLPEVESVQTAPRPAPPPGR